MGGMIQRDLLKGSFGLVAASALSRPALASGQKVTVWWNQGFYPAEDQAFRTLIAAWEKSPVIPSTSRCFPAKR